MVTLSSDEGFLRFEVRDDGDGFSMNGTAPTGHGFVNMVDRLGAIGGRLEVESTLGSGTTVRGEIPLTV